MPETGGRPSRRASGSPRSGISSGPRYQSAVSRLRDEVLVQKALTIAWALLFVPGIVFWRGSIMFLVFCSIYANFVGHLSAWEAAKAAREVKEAQDER